MKTFKSFADFDQLPPADPARAVIQGILNDFLRDADIHGYIIFVEPGDTEISLPELKRPIADMSWDGVWLKDGHYHAVYCTNNSFCIEFIFPASIDGAIRENLEAHI